MNNMKISNINATLKKTNNVSHTHDLVYNNSLLLQNSVGILLVLSYNNLSLYDTACSIHWKYQIPYILNTGSYYATK